MHMTTPKVKIDKKIFFEIYLALQHVCPKQGGSGGGVWLAVHEDGVSLLSPSSLEPRETHTYSQLAAFGGDGDHLVLVASSESYSHSNPETEKLLLAMSKAKVCVRYCACMKFTEDYCSLLKMDIHVHVCVCMYTYEFPYSTQCHCC